MESGKEKGSRIPLAPDPACRPLAFSIVLTDREPGTGYVLTFVLLRDSIYLHIYKDLYGENNDCFCNL